MPTVDAYWNHNVAYHRWIVAVADRCHGDVLDVGCGDGLLLERLAPGSATVTGIDRDPPSVHRAQTRLAHTANASLIAGDFITHPFGEARFDLVVFAASLHHMDLAAALTKARRLIRPGGRLLVVGRAARQGTAGWVLDALRVPVVRISGLVHHETQTPVAPTADPTQSVRQIRAIADQVIPGARLRQGLYYRYLLTWTNPAALGTR
jgi:SAM-dependent methyltransferase